MTPSPARRALALALAAVAASAAGCQAPPPDSPGEAADARASAERAPVGPAGRPVLRAADTARPDWRRFFDAEGGAGTFVLLDAETDVTQRLDPDRAARRYLPASTFKVYNALVALETGVVTDPDSVFVWDGAEREVTAWNRDHTLRAGMEASTVWLYQRVARRVGRGRYRAALGRQPYGNGEVGADVGLFWLDNSLQISADEQVRFLNGLRRGALAFRPGVQATVRDVLPVLAEAGGARLVGKTGLGRQPDGAPLGWLVGWVERDGQSAVFAMNVEPDPGAGREIDLVPARLRIVRAVLASEGWLGQAAPHERP